IPRAAANFRFFATAVLHAHTESYRTDQLALNYTLRQPRGVAGVLSPWNLPLYLFTWKVAPALATGNTVVAKPSELTPTTAHLLSELCQEIGLPPGVLNVVHGYDTQGEICLCGSRIFVEERLYPAFVEQFTAAARRLKVGDPLDPTVDQGALISRRHLDRVRSYIQLAQTEGGQVLCGGDPPSPAR